MFEIPRKKFLRTELYSGQSILTAEKRGNTFHLINIMTHVWHLYQLRPLSARKSISSHFPYFGLQKSTKKCPTRTKWQKPIFCPPGNPQIFLSGIWKRSMSRSSLKVVCEFTPFNSSLTPVFLSYWVRRSTLYEGCRSTWKGWQEEIPHQIDMDEQ